MHPAELPIKKIQEALGIDNPIRKFWVQNPSDKTSPSRMHNKVRITFDSERWVDATGEGNNVAEASEDLIRNLEAARAICYCGCRLSVCELGPR